ncbi:hypothetical protein BKA64DRAFT_639296 [Cadophora sp. MPI-SDFR-AT-0126]|nr:hypothetical protein BKA64DRAFT_639296 [Leotiomycetes sp. MPI-SDFR-AT-0126]
MRLSMMQSALRYITETKSTRKLECGTADARGALGLGQISNLLARQQARGVRVRRQDGAALGHRDRSTAADARGPLGLGQGSRDKTVRLWDATIGALQQTLEGYSGWVRSVASSPDGKAYSLLVSNEWIREGEINILWLPPEYRATSIAIWNSSVALGHSSGNVSFLKFKRHICNDLAVTGGLCGQDMYEGEDQEQFKDEEIELEE